VTVEVEDGMDVDADVIGVVNGCVKYCVGVYVVG
jgi:hypothetical protein